MKSKVHRELACRYIENRTINKAMVFMRCVCVYYSLEIKLLDFLPVGKRLCIVRIDFKN